VRGCHASTRTLGRCPESSVPPRRFHGGLGMRIGSQGRRHDLHVRQGQCRACRLTSRLCGLRRKGSENLRSLAPGNSRCRSMRVVVVGAHIFPCIQRFRRNGQRGVSSGMVRSRAADAGMAGWRDASLCASWSLSTAQRCRSGRPDHPKPWCSGTWVGASSQSISRPPRAPRTVERPRRQSGEQRRPCSAKACAPWTPVTREAGSMRGRGLPRSAGTKSATGPDDDLLGRPGLAPPCRRMSYRRMVGIIPGALCR
jgi:hypothetical protein